MINDALKNDYGANAVRYSLLSAAVTTSVGALLFVWAARTIRGVRGGDKVFHWSGGDLQSRQSKI